MQTFMPYNSYVESAKLLDHKRLGKQRVECYQILKALNGDYGTRGAWVNHPATRMWDGYKSQLAAYGQAMCLEWQRRGYDDSLLPRFIEYTFDDTVTPWWVNHQLLNLTHQSNLLRKDPTYYTFAVSPDMPYVWPLADESSFRLGTVTINSDLTALRGKNIYVAVPQFATLLGLTPREFRMTGKYQRLGQPDRVIRNTNLWLLQRLDALHD